MYQQINLRLSLPSRKMQIETTPSAVEDANQNLAHRHIHGCLSSDQVGTGVAFDDRA